MKLKSTCYTQNDFDKKNKFKFHELPDLKTNFYGNQDSVLLAAKRPSDQWTRLDIT